MAEAAYVVGVDVGTTAVKAVVVDSEGAVVGAAEEHYALSSPRDGWVEQEPDDWWRLLARCTRAATADLDASAVRGLALSTQGDTSFPVDERSRPLRPAITWLDTRAREEVAELERALPAEEWYRITGSRLGAYAAALRGPWLRKHEPDVWARTRRIAMVADWLNERLCGRAALDVPNASRTVLLDIVSRRWSPELMAAAELDTSLWPEVVPSGEALGTLTPQAAEELGLSTDTVVVAGGHDQTCAAVGAGVLDPGDVLLSCGTAWVVLAALAEPTLPPGREMQIYCHAAPGRSAALGAYAGGSVLNWLRDGVLGGVEQGVPFEMLDQLAADAPPRSPLLFLPHFYGRTLQAQAARGSIIGLTLHHELGHIVRALHEGVALETRANLDVLRRIGAPVRALRMIGGGAKSRVWPQIVADACGVPVALPEVREAAAYGAALLAGVTVGLFADLASAAARVPTRSVAEPDAERSPYYEELFALFQSSFDELAPVCERLLALGPEGDAPE